MGVHNILLNNGKHTNTKLQAIHDFYGPIKWVKIREYISEEEAFHTEKALISQFGRMPNGILCNMTDGGDGGSGISLETRIKMSLAGKGRKFTPEHKAAISAALKGKPKSPEHREKVRLAKLGKPAHPIIGILCSKRFKGIPKTPEHNAKNSAALKGRVFSPETIAKMSASKRAMIARKKAELAAKSQTV